MHCMHCSTLIKAPSEIILPLAVLTGKITLGALFERHLLIRMALTSTQALVLCSDTLLRSYIAFSALDSSHNMQKHRLVQQKYAAIAAMITICPCTHKVKEQF